MSNNNKKTYRLNKTQNMLSTNIDGYIPISLESNQKEIPESEIIKEFDIENQYNQDRLNCTSYRFIVEIDPVFTNVLQNVTGKDSLCIFNETRFLDSGFGFEDQKKWIAIGVKPNNITLGTTYKQIDGGVVEESNGSTLYDVTLANKTLNITGETKVVVPESTFICWKYNGDIYSVLESPSTITVSEDANYEAFFTNTDNKLTNNVNIVSSFDSQTSEYTYMLQTDFPVKTVGGLIVSGLVLDIDGGGSPIDVITEYGGNISIGINQYGTDTILVSTTQYVTGSTFVGDLSSDDYYNWFYNGEIQ